MNKKAHVDGRAVCRNLLLLIGLNGLIPAYAGTMPDPLQLLQQLGIAQAQLGDLEQGKTVSFDVAELSAKELAAGVVVYLPAAPAKIVDIVRKGNMASIDSDITASGIIMRANPAQSLQGFAYSAKQSDEAEDFLGAEAGDDFNLSTEEIATLKALAQSGNNATVDAASQAYRTLLLKRLDAYRKTGLQGIAPYSRGSDDAADPAAELRTIAVNSKVVAQYFPELQQVWLNYPAALPAGAEENFFWINRTVEKRPTPILGHRIISVTDAGAVILSRQFYVGHSYNSSQLTVGCLPYKDGSLVFYASRTSTDQVAGMGSSLKHSIGREQMRGEIINRLKKLRQLL